MFRARYVFTKPRIHVSTICSPTFQVNSLEKKVGLQVLGAPKRFQDNFKTYRKYGFMFFASTK